jgi:Tol biopolymer transport system component
VAFQHFRLVNDLVMTSLGPNTEARSLTYNGFHMWPRLSPSGEKLISVLRQVDNTERLCLIDLKTRESSQLTDREGLYPGWLDEENIAFLSRQRSSHDTEVLVVNTVTRETRPLTVFAGEAAWLAIHPDKKRLAVVLESTDGTEKIILRDLSNELDSTIHEGEEYEFLRWSPDGSALCWSRPGTSRNAPHVSGGIWLIELGQSEPRFIAKDGYCPAWSQDGAAIYYTMRKGQQGLWRYDLKQKTEQLVRSWETVFVYDIAGTRLVFAQHRNDSQVYSMSLD